LRFEGFLGGKREAEGNASFAVLIAQFDNVVRFEKHPTLALADNEPHVSSPHNRGESSNFAFQDNVIDPNPKPQVVFRDLGFRQREVIIGVSADTDDRMDRLEDGSRA
jgi:hypothetical protein